MDAAEITEKFHLAEIKNNEWNLSLCCAKKGEGLEEGMDWLTEKLL